MVGNCPVACRAQREARERAERERYRTGAGAMGSFPRDDAQSDEEVLEELLDEEDALGVEEEDTIDPYTGLPIRSAEKHSAEYRGYQHRAARFVQGHERTPPPPPAVQIRAELDDDDGDDVLGFSMDSWVGLLLAGMCVATLSATCMLSCMRSTMQQTTRTRAEKLV